MNKLLLKPLIEIKGNGTYYLEVSNNVDSFELCVFPFVTAKILIVANSFKGNIKVDILEGANLSFEVFAVTSSFLYDVHLKEYGGSFNFAYSALTNSDEKHILNIHHEASNTNSNVVNHVVHYGNDKAFIRVDGYIPKGSLSCNMIQDNKIMLMADGTGEILPNLYISEFDSFSEHSAYISKFSKDELFYLESRGINKKDASNLLKRAFLLGGFSCFEESDEINDIKSELIYTIYEFGGDYFES